MRTNIKPQVDKFTFPDGHSIFILAEGRLSEQVALRDILRS